MPVGRSLALRAHGGRFAVLVLAACITAALVGKLVETAFADPASPITVTKSASSSTVASGAQLTYTIVIKNTSGAALKNLVLSDQINGLGVVQTPPALPQLTITSTKGSCTQGGPNGNLVTCNGGAMAGGETWTVTIGGQVTAGSGTTLNNTASVTGTKSAQNFTTLSNAVATPVTGGAGGNKDLSINKTGPTSVAPSAPITWTLTVNNTGTANATGVKVVDTVPVGVTGVSATGSSLFVCSVDAVDLRTVTCTGGAVNQGQNATITINGTAPAATGTITNTSVVDPDNTIVETNELNNTSATVYTNVGGPPAGPLLDIKKTDGAPIPAAPNGWATGAGPDPVTPGMTLTYKIQVTNTATGSNARADDVVTTDATQGLVASSIVASQTIVNGTVGTTGGCVVIAPQVKCSLKSLNSLGTQTITITGTVIQSAGSSIFNTATVTGNIKNQGVTNTASEVTTVRPQVDLTITKADSPDPVCARSWPTGAANTPQHLPLTAFNQAPPASGVPATLLAPPVCLGGLTYDFVVGNSGIVPVTEVVVRDPLPPGVIFDSYSTDGGFVCGVDPITNVVTCSGGSIPSQDIRHISFRLVAPPNVGSITNTVYVDPNNTIFEPDETNNTATESTSVATGIDLVIFKSDNGPASLVPVDPPGGGTVLEGFDPIATNGTDTYTIIVDNVGTQDSTGIKVRDTLPAGTKFLSVTSDRGFTCSHDGSATGGNVTCISGHLFGTESEFYDPPGPAGPTAADDFATIKIKVFVTPFVQPVMHNEVRVDPDNEIAEVNELNNLAFDNTTVGVGDADHGAFNQLKITKTQTDPSVAAGDPDATVATNGTLIYNLHVTNAGTDPVSNVVVKDFLPTGSRFISAGDTAVGSAAFFCTHDGAATGGVITCTGGDFSGSLNTIFGVPIERDITVTIFAPNVPGAYTNHATVDPDNVVAEGNEFDNDAFLNTTVTVGGNNMFNELTISKTQTVPGSNKVATSSKVTYEIVVSNTGSDPAFNVKLTDTLPAGFTFISALDNAPASDPHRFNCVPAAGNTIDCTGATLSGLVNPAPGEPTSWTIVVKAFSSAIPGDYTNTAIVDPANAIPEGNETNNTANAPTTVLNGGPGPFIDLQIDKTGPDKATPGGQMEYDIHVTNVGAADAFNVAVRDVLPPYVSFFNAADFVVGAGMFTCGHSSGVVNCTGGTIPAGGFRDIRILVLAPASIEQFASNQGDVSVGITNQAFVDPDNAIAEGDETNNSDSVDTTIKSKINLTITKEGPDTAHQNDTTDYVIKVKNNAIDGGATASGVRMIDSLPVGLIPLSVKADPSNFQCQLFENPVNTVDCIGDLSAGQEVTITVHVFVTADGGPLDNEACVDPNHTIAETNELDNCRHKITDVPAPAPNLLMSKSADTVTVTSGQQFTYTLTVSNVGDGATTAPVKVTDPLPSQVTLVNINPDAAFNCAASTTTNVDCTLPSLAPGEAQSIKVIVTLNDGVTAPFTNTATASGGGDPSPSSKSLTTFVGGSGTDLVLASVDDQPDPVAAGAVVTYSIVVLNTGTDDTAPFDVTQVFDDLTGMTLLSAVGSQGFTCGLTSVTVTCHGSLLAGKSTTLTIKFDTDASAVPSVSSDITVDSGGVITESNEGNNTDNEVTSISAAFCSSCIDLVMGPIFGTPDPVANGDDVTWNFDVTNIGDLPTSSDPAPHDVVIAANVDTSVNEYSSVVASASNPAFTCVVNAPPVFPDPPTAPEVVCTGPSLNAGESVIISVTATANTAADPSFLDFSAAADPGFQITEFNEANNTGTHSVVVDTPPPGP